MTSTSTGGFLTDLLASLPNAIASPFLEYYRTKSQKDVLIFTMEARRLERADILLTMRVLAEHNQLTPELSQILSSAFYQAGLPIY